MIGRTLSHFRIIEKLGEGGMGVVYRAEDERLRRPVALKVLPPELVGDEERRLRFLREARAAAAVNHPNIATIHEIDEADGTVFIAMELVEGKTLRDLLGRGPLPVRDAVRIASQIADGLSRAHQAQVIHRDLKPDNVIVAADGHAKILDFGLAKLLEEQSGVVHPDLSQLKTISRDMTREGRIFGTAAYMSPEQARGQVVDHRSDLFSFGTMLYEMATGRLPFEGATATDVMSAIIRDIPAPASAQNAGIPPELDRIIGECLEKDPADRYQHTDQLAVDLRKLRRATDSGVQTVRTPGAPLTADRRTARGLLNSRRARIVTLAILGALAFGAGVTAWLQNRAPEGFKTGARILVADFENGTGRQEFDAGIRIAVATLLRQSNHLHALGGRALDSLVASVAGSNTMRLDTGLAERVCREGHCDGFLTGRIETDGAGYIVRAQLFSVGSDHPVTSSHAAASVPDDLLMTLHAIVLDLRRGVGESPQAVAGTPPPTTRSLHAYQTWARAIQSETMEDCIPVARQATEIDPGFVEAYLTEYDCAWTTGAYRASRAAAEAAHRQAGKHGDQVRLWAEIYHLEATYQFDLEIERAKMYRRLFPFYAEAATWLGVLHDGAPEWDPAFAESQFRDAYRLRADRWSAQNLTEALFLQGNAQEIENIAHDWRTKGASEGEMAALLLKIPAISRDSRAYLQAIDRSQRDLGSTESDVAEPRAVGLAQAGRLADLEKVLPLRWQAVRQSRDARSLIGIAITEAWLNSRRHGRKPVLQEQDLRPIMEGLQLLPFFSSSSVELGVAEPLERAIAIHEKAEARSTTRYVKEELQFARGCLALIRGDATAARTSLEPLAERSNHPVRHRMLGRTYEALGMLQEAAQEYEKPLENPRLRWGNIFLILDQYRLATVYERLGDTARARHWYEQFLTDWKGADPDIPEVIEARKRLQELGGTAPKTEQPTGAAPR